MSDWLGVGVDATVPRAQYSVDVDLRDTVLVSAIWTIIIELVVGVFDPSRSAMLFQPVAREQLVHLIRTRGR